MNKKKNKKGVWREYLLPIILGLLVVGIILYFIFNEYFTKDTLDLEACRESIILRAGSPDIEIAGANFESTKDKFPLKCKTEVVTIDFNDTKKAEKLLTEALAQCWYLYLEGEQQIFPKTALHYDSFCTPCARIHFDKEVRTYYTTKENTIDIIRGLEQPLRNTPISGKEYLKLGFQTNVQLDEATTMGAASISPLAAGIRMLFSNPETNRISTIGKENFFIDDKQTEGVVNSISTFFTGANIAQLNLPRYINSQQGDLLIFLSQIVKDTNDKDTLLFWFQTEQQKQNPSNPDPFLELKKTYIKEAGHEVTLCDYYDGVPA